MNQYHWELLNWIKDNSEEESKVFFFFGAIYGQNALLRNVEREHYLVSSDDYSGALAAGEIRRNYTARLGGDYNGVHYAYRKGLFSFGYYFDEMDKSYFTGPRDICDMDYFVLDINMLPKEVVNYNVAIANRLIEKGAAVVFENSVGAVIKNNNKGDCV